MDKIYLFYIAIGIIALIIIGFVVSFLRRRSGGDAESQQLYVGNLAYKVVERDLRKIFSQYGRISHLKIVKDRHNGRSKGFGFVTFEGANEADAALAAHGEQVLGRNIVVRIAKPR